MNKSYELRRRSTSLSSIENIVLPDFTLASLAIPVLNVKTKKITSQS